MPLNYGVPPMSTFDETLADLLTYLCGIGRTPNTLDTYRHDRPAS